MKSRRSVYLSTVVAVLGGLLFGFDTAVISGTVGALERVYGLDEFWLGFAVAVALIGTIVGGFTAASPLMPSAADACSSCWPRSTSSRRSAAPWRRAGSRS